ncbi:MAG TPA: hypothetical protein VHD62_18390 [Opitutaceae bacterium]|nr:hypothetical protein [Opitutaceae bacterium]
MKPLVVRLAFAGFAAACFFAPPTRAENWAPNLSLATTWNSDVTNANRAADRIGALQFAAEALAGDRISLARSDALFPAVHLGADATPRFAALAAAAAGLRGEWQHKFGLGPLAPVFSLAFAGDFVGAREPGRRGISRGATLTLRKRLDAATRLALTQEFSRLDARDSVYDRRAAEAALELARDLTPAVGLTLAAFWRTGDVLSYATPPRPELVALAPNRRTVDTFGRPMVAYSIDAPTVGGKIGVVRALDVASSATLSYEYRATERGPLRYTNHLVSLALVRQF